MFTPWREAVVWVSMAVVCTSGVDGDGVVLSSEMDYEHHHWEV